MPRAQTALAEAEKKALTAFCKEHKISESALLRKMIFQVLGDRIEHPPEIEPVENQPSQQINLWLGKDEVEQMTTRAKKEGFTKRTTWAASVIRQALLSIPVLSETEIKVLHETNRELAAVGRNLNQVVRAINIKDDNIDQFTPELFTALQAAIADQRAKAAKIINHALNRWELKNA